MTGSAAMTAIAGQQFLAPGRLWLLVIVVALAGAHVAALRWRRAAQVRFTRPDMLASVAPRRPSWRRHVVAGLQLLGLAAAVVAIARPVEVTTERLESEGRIVLVFDVSFSMMATDVPPDRFEAAKTAARNFVDAVDPDVEIALISFAGVVSVEVPATRDRPQVLDGIDRLELGPATAIGDALVVATRLLENVDDPTLDGPGSDDPAADDPAGRDGRDDDRPPGVVVLLTDGETTVGRPTAEGAERAAEAGVPVYSISFGTPFGVVDDPGGSGQLIPVPVRPDELEVVAELTGGATFEAETAEELAAVYDEIRGSLGETLGETIEVITERTWLWAMGSFLLLALAWSLGLWWLRGIV